MSDDGKSNYKDQIAAADAKLRGSLWPEPKAESLSSMDAEFAHKLQDMRISDEVFARPYPEHYAQAVKAREIEFLRRKQEELAKSILATPIIMMHGGKLGGAQTTAPAPVPRVPLYVIADTEGLAHRVRDSFRALFDTNTIPLSNTRASVLTHQEQLRGLDRSSVILVLTSADMRDVPPYVREMIDYAVVNKYHVVFAEVTQ